MCTEVKDPIDKVFVYKLKSQSWKTWEIVVMGLRKEANPLQEDTDTEKEHLFSLEKMNKSVAESFSNVKGQSSEFLFET